MNIIEIVDFSLKIKDKVLFDNVNLNIKEHSWLVLTGNIGSGKSTLLRTICKLNKEKYCGLITYKENNIVEQKICNFAIHYSNITNNLCIYA